MYIICTYIYIYVHIFIFIMSAISMKYIWNFQKLYFKNIEKIIQLAYVNYCEAHQL